MNKILKQFPSDALTYDPYVPVLVFQPPTNCPFCGRMGNYRCFVGMGTDQYGTDTRGFIIRRFVPVDPHDERLECPCEVGTWLGNEEPFHLVQIKKQLEEDGDPCEEPTTHLLQ